MNRIDRVTAILIQLQSRRIVKAQDIAERFGISLRTVYRDISTLCEAGVPILGEAGVGYSIMDGYRLPPVMFTKEEAMAFLTAEKLVEKLTDQSIRESYRSAMYKVRAVLKSTEKSLLEHMEQHIEIRHTSPSFLQETDNAFLNPILKSITDQRCLQVQYQAFGTEVPTQRIIEPIGIFFAYEHWHVIAFCRLRNDYRDFRVDRLVSVQPTALPFSTEHPVLKDYLNKITAQQKLHTIVIEVDREVLKYIDRQKFVYGFVEQMDRGEWIEMTFVSAWPDMFVRWFLLFAEKARIVSPVSLQEELRNRVFQLYQQLYPVSIDS